ncbi:MAG: hypothetical protein KAS57_06535 [Gammaproteobacteria bacterium]|nr:hypothetical protein [Gammaproteobacteria bacterium]
MAVSCDKDPQWQALPLPALPDDTIHLRVANVINSRFPQLSDEQLQQVLDKTVLMVRQHFKLSVAFDKPKQITIQKLFDSLPEHVKKERRNEIVKFGAASNTDIINMRESIDGLINKYWDHRQAVIDYANPYLLTPIEGNDINQLSAALVGTLLKRLKYWQTQKAADGRPVIDDQPYNEWVWWDSLGYGEVPYDVVVTNQLVASAEMYDLSVHSSIRGGITAGTTTYSKQARYGSYVYIMVYPMLNDSEMLVELRDDKTYSSDQATTYAAALLTHEIGHQLLHLGHPFGNSNCIMSPTPLLKYRDWVDGLDASQCALNSEPSMTPGFVNIDYRADW